MDIEALTSILDEFDITKVIPSLDSMLGKLDLLLRIIVMAGPLVMLGLGLYYFLASPKEANHRAGYRFYYGMSKVATWQFTQRLAGIAYSALGVVLTPVMAIICIRFGSMIAPDMVMLAVKCVLWELVLVVVATLVVNFTVILRYDRKGNLRSGKKKE